MNQNWRPGSRHDILIGSRWRSRDPRDHGRTITLIEVDPCIAQYGNGFVWARTSARRSRLRASTLLSRYELVESP